MQCPLCSSEQTELFHDKVWLLESGKVFHCLDCAVTFLSPMMEERQEKDFYQNYNAHIQKRGVSLSGSSAELHKKSIAAAVERYGIVSSFFKPAERVLEVGSSTGAFLQLLNGQSCFAVEPADANREFSRQFATDVYRHIDEIPAAVKFDVICMFHVFEHIKQPVDFLENCRQHLNPNGLIIIEVPHIADPLISLYQCSSYKDFYFQPMHPFVHSIKSLRTIFVGQGFRERQVIYHQRYGLVNHLNWLASGTPGGNPEWQGVLGENREYKTALEKTGYTDTVFYIAEG